MPAKRSLSRRSLKRCQSHPDYSRTHELTICARLNDTSDTDEVDSAASSQTEVETSEAEPEYEPPSEEEEESDGSWECEDDGMDIMRSSWRPYDY